MSALKDQDPDYGPSDANNEKHQRIYEENARSSTARKITSIIEKEFSQEINTKENEILEIQERLHRASKILHLLRYVIVADFYNRKQCQNSQNGDAKQTQIHPAIRQLIGKSLRPFDSSTPTLKTATSSDNYFNGPQSTSSSPFSVTDCTTIKAEKVVDVSEHVRLEKRSSDADEISRPKKIPRYIPPKSGLPEPQCPSRGIRHKFRKRVIIGNISKWIPPEWREDAASHKWTMYVRGNKENPDIDDFVNKVRFFLHPSYRPNDVVEVTAAPFCLSRRGWGEFPLRVQLHFKSTLNKPMDIIHHLKLDRTYTGLQTLGSETLVDIWIYADCRNSNRNIGKIIKYEFKEEENNSTVKQENNEDSNYTSDFTCSTQNESLKLTDKDSVTVKQEPVDDIKMIDDSVHLKKLQFYIELDHDYCGSKFLNGSGGNLTIDHTLAESAPIDSSVNKTSTDESIMVITNDHSINEDSNNLKVKEKVINESKNSVDEPNRNSLKVHPLSFSKVHSNLRPLEIFIPPLFEPSRNKHVLVLQNNKTIPVDLAVPRADDHCRNASRGVSLLKKPPGIETTTIQVQNVNERKVQQEIKLQLSKSILLNVNSNIPVLKIVEKGNLLNDLPSNLEGGTASEQTSRANYQELKLSRQKITLGKDKHKLQSKKEFYDEVLRTIETAKIENMESLLRFIVRRMPMITPNVSDPDYRRLHPYACGSEEEFFSYNIAKRSACEWYRAKMIRSFMKKKSFIEEKLWSIKEVMVWSRLHGYIPVCPDFGIRTMKQQKCLPDSVIAKSISTCTEPETFCKWLQVYPSRANDQLFDCNTNQFNELDIDVDVLNDDVTLTKKKKSNKEENKDTINSNVTILELENQLAPFHNFICETAREIGVKLISEEVIPNVVHCAASRMIMRATECLIEDLVRMSLAKAWERCSDNGCPKVIVLDDVRGALLNREEFDMFTNQGLGSKFRFTATE